MSTTTISSIRAMAWKEWREQRSVLLGGIVIVILLPLFLGAGSAAFRGEIDFGWISEALVLSLLCLVWPTFAAAAGAGTFSGEIGQGTLDFLLTRPVARRTLWLVKVGMGAATVAVSVACSGAIAWTLHAVVSDESFGTLTWSWFDIDGLGAGIFAGSLLVLFASATFFSTFLPRPITAAAAGLGSSLAILTITFAFWYRLDVEPGASPELVVPHLTGIGLIILTAAMALFCHRDASARRGPLVAGLVVIAVVAASPAVMVAALTPLSPESAALGTLALSPSGDAIATTASRADGSSPRVWLLRTDGSGVERLTPRLTMSPAFSPDGEWIGYMSRRSWIGITTADVSLRAIRPDGSGDHLLVDGIPTDEIWQSEGIFSPDSSRIALVSEDRLAVARIGAGEVAGASLRGTPAEGGYLVGWTQDGREVLVSSRLPEGHGMRLMAFDHLKNEWRAVWESGRYPGFTGWYGPAAGYSHLPFVLERDDESGHDLILVNVDDGSEKTIAQGVCQGSVSMLDAGDAIAWATCGTDATGALVSEIRVRDLATGQEHRLAEVSGKVVSLGLSPSRDLALVRRRFTQKWEPLIPTIVRADGSTQDLPEGWFAIGWSSPSRVVVASSGDDRLAMVETATGEMHRIH